jgi:zinc protease
MSRFGLMVKMMKMVKMVRMVRMAVMSLMTILTLCVATAPIAAAAPHPAKRAASAGSRPALPPPAPWKAPVPTEIRTKSGARVVVLPAHELPLVHLLVTVRAGAALDPRDRPGLAAATAMMLQEGGAGTRSGPEVAAALEALGGELQLECDRDGVRLHLTVLGRHLEPALRLVGDLLARPRFDGAEWTRARSRRMGEIVHRRDEPHYIADAVFDRTLFGDAHPYGAPALGTVESLERMTAEELRAFYAAHYGPRTTSVLLVGDVTPAEAAQRVDEALAGWTSTAAPAPPPAAATAPLPRLVIVDRPGAPQSELRVGHLGLPRSTPDFPAMYLLETLLGGSFTSRLNQNLREKHGYTYGVRAHFLLQDAPGPFEIQTAVRTDVTAPSLAEIVAELRAIRAPIDGGEAAKGKALVRSAIVDAFGGGQEAAALVGDLVMHGLPLDAWSRLPAALDRLGSGDLGRTAARLFQPDELVVVVVGDRKAIEPSLRALPFVKSIEYRDVDGRVVAAPQR